MRRKGILKNQISGKEAFGVAIITCVWCHSIGRDIKKFNVGVSNWETKIYLSGWPYLVTDNQGHHMEDVDGVTCILLWLISPICARRAGCKSWDVGSGLEWFAFSLCLCNLILFIAGGTTVGTASPGIQVLCQCFQDIRLDLKSIHWYIQRIFEMFFQSNLNALAFHKFYVK